MTTGLYQKSARVETYNESSSHDQRSTGFVHDTPANNRDFVSKPLTWRKLLIQPHVCITTTAPRVSVDGDFVSVDSDFRKVRDSEHEPL